MPGTHMAIDVHLTPRWRPMLMLMLWGLLVISSSCAGVLQQDADSPLQPGPAAALSANASCPWGCDSAPGSCVLDAADGDWVCLRCLRGLIVNKADGACACPRGMYASSNNTCADCNKGYYCPGGDYTESGGFPTGPMRVPCPGNMTTLGLRSSTIKSCVNLPGYFYSTDANGTTVSALSCPVDSYGPGLKKQRACVPCPAYYTTNGFEGQSRPASCVIPAGWFMKAARQLAPCPKGEYKPLIGPSTCIKCTNGSTTLIEGATSIDNCTEPCSGYTNTSTGIREACLAKLWAAAGCSLTSPGLPDYSRNISWANSSMAAIKSDMKQRAANSTDEHRSGCYSKCINTTCAATGQGSCDPATGDCTEPCAPYSNASTGISQTCLAKLWSDVGCTRTDLVLPAYSKGLAWINSTLADITANMSRWAANASDERRSGCYSKCSNTTCAATGQGSCDPATSACTEPCAIYTNMSTGVSAACLAQMWSDAGCTRMEAVLPAYSTSSWWLNSTKDVIGDDMRQWASNASDEYRSGCYKTCTNTVCSASGRGSCDPATGNCTGACAGYSNSSTGVSASCLAEMWSSVGCTRMYLVPSVYSSDSWVNSSKATLADDMVKWASNISDEYRSGCYSKCINTTCSATGQGSCDPATGNCTGPCSAYINNNTSTGVGAACLAQLWFDVGCTRSDLMLPIFANSSLWLNVALAAITEDFTQWAANTADEYRGGCYRKCINTTCAATGQGSCDPATGNCTGACAGYTNTSIGVTAACLAQMWSGVGCTRPDLIPATYSKDALWVNGTKDAIWSDMLNWAANSTDEHRSGCYSKCINTTCAATGRGSCQPSSGNCTG